MQATVLRCHCGLAHEDVSHLTKLGWRELGGGTYGLLSRCPCGAVLASAYIRDGSTCDVCKRLVTGTDGDVKVCLVQDHKALVICLGCFRRRDPRPYTRDRRRFS
jgi:hypothetical protein